MDYLEFIARVTSHIPDKGQVMVRYYGLYANAHRGKVRKASLVPVALGVIEEEPPPIPSKGWAEELLADQKPEDLPGEDFGQPRVAQTRDPAEDPGSVHAALGHQGMEVRVEVDPVPEGLDGDNDARNKLFRISSLSSSNTRSNISLSGPKQ